jgi:hypothetical protein
MNKKEKEELLRSGVGYYLAPACIDRILPSLIKEVADGSTELTASTQKEGALAKYHLTMPGKSLYIASDSYALRNTQLLKSKNFHNWRALSDSPFGLINHFDSPDRIAGFLKSTKLILQDSGGFQMATGKTDFVCPEYVLEKHRNNADIGVTLDIPIYPFTHAITAETIPRVASVTERTNRYFLKSGYSSFMNLNHGRNIKERLKWMESTQKKAPGVALCIGGFISNNRRKVLPKAFAATVVKLIQASGYRYFHVLGVSTSWQQIILASIAHRYKVLITSDSTSWLTLARRGCLITPNYDVYQLPKSKPGHKTDKLLNCVCPACSIFQYEALYSHNTRFALVHNLLAADRIASQINAVFAGNPDLSVDWESSLVKENMKGVDAYINGERVWKDTDELKTGTTKIRESLFSSSEDFVHADLATQKASLNRILTAYDKFFAERGI